MMQSRHKHVSQELSVRWRPAQAVTVEQPEDPSVKIMEIAILEFSVMPSRTLASG